MINLLIARHGNTFDAGDIIRRVGKGTDIPLSNSGKLQAKLLGEYLQRQHPDITMVYTSTLQRTINTAEVALQTMGSDIAINRSSIFDEIDYGLDEGKPESEVIARLGEAALKKWEENNTVPNGWNVDPVRIKNTWREFADKMQHDYPNQTILVITSNGIARFAPEHAIKLNTGAVSHLIIEGNRWFSVYTNHRPG
jgi:2,3-bisphosphoglycerate-dependent phosphoglycerate mutase